jgi:hypothetical protein
MRGKDKTMRKMVPHMTGKADQIYLVAYLHAAGNSPGLKTE